MPSRLIDFEFDTFYHIYNRGYNKQRLFWDEKDYEKIISNLEKYREKFPHIKIVSYSILPNHFHLLICCSLSASEFSTDLAHSSPDSHKTTREAVPISSFMLKVPLKNI